MKQSSIFSYVKQNSNNSEGVDSIEQEAPPFKQTKCNKTTKVRKWDEAYLKYGFFLPVDQILNVAPQPKCLICCKRLSNSALVPAKLQKHLEANHAAYETKTISFFKHMKSSICKQKDSFLGAQLKLIKIFC